MKLKSVLLLAVAMSCGLVAMLGVQQVLSKDNQGNGEPEMTKVLVAKSEIAPGSRLTEENVEFKDLAIASVPVGAVTKAEEYEDRALKGSAYPGEVILQAKLGRGVGATADIPSGMRVITVAVDQTMTFSGLLLPGNRVDVLVTYKERIQNRGMVPSIKTVLQYVKVFATDSIRDAAGAETNEIKVKNISLLVTPEEANVLKLAEDKGKLHLSLRAEEQDAVQGIAKVEEWLYRDESQAAVEEQDEEAPTAKVVKKTANLDEFLDQQQEPAEVPVVPEKKTWSIEIFRGDSKSVQEVELPVDNSKQQFANETNPNNQTARAPWLNSLKGFFTGPGNKSTSGQQTNPNVITQ